MPDQSRPDVMLDDSGNLFLLGGSNGASTLFHPDSFDSLVPLAQWQTLMAERRSRFAALGIPWRLLLSPEKLSVQGDALLARLIGPRFSSPATRFAGHLGPDSLFLPHGLLRGASDLPAYPRSDSHWTGAAANLAFIGLMQELGLDVDASRYAAQPDLCLTYRGDLWSAAFPTVPAEPFLRKHVPAQIRTIYRNPVIGLKDRLGRHNEMGLHVHSHAIFHNEHAEQAGTVVLFGSSFSDCRLECSLLTFRFALTFRTVHFIWSTDVDFDYVARHRPDLVVVEMPERFLGVCPSDRLDIEAAGAALAARWLRTHGEDER